MSILEGSNILITGGTGSFGKECAKKLLDTCNPKRLVILSRDEQKHVDMARNVLPPAQYPQVRYFVGDVRDPQRLKTAMRGIDYVIHAAAMKHVDIAEYNPQECISTNIGGAENLINACIEANVKRLVALSTDKAAAPVNLYGATKLCSDKLFAAANSLSGANGTRFCAVRYGNVIGSNGSVIPFFQNKRHEGVLPITSEEMTRFVITLEQGVDFVIKAFERMTGGELFVPKIPSVSIVDIAHAVAPECETKVIGIRPGEKMHECMVPEDEARQTLEFDDYYIVQPSARPWSQEVPHYVAEGKQCQPGFSYSSDNNSYWLSVEELREVINQHCPDPTRKEEITSTKPGLKIRRAA
jgi:UDP-N-acetylglucosamine 4,6-dehydratase